MMTSTSFTIGKVTGVHGLGGNLKVWSFAESIDTYTPGRTLRLTSDGSTGADFTILRASAHKKGVLLNLEGVDTREDAESLIGHEILIDRDQLPEPEEDTWFQQDLIGLEVKDRHTGYIGKICQIFPTGAHDILVVRDKERETLVPMHRHFVDSVDIEAHLVRVNLPEEF